MGNNKPRKALPLTLYTAPAYTGSISVPGPPPARFRAKVTYIRAKTGPVARAQGRPSASPRVYSREYHQTLLPPSTLKQAQHELVFYTASLGWSIVLTTAEKTAWQALGKSLVRKITGHNLYMRYALNGWTKGRGPGRLLPSQRTGAHDFLVPGADCHATGGPGSIAVWYDLTEFPGYFYWICVDALSVASIRAVRLTRIFPGATTRFYDTLTMPPGSYRVSSFATEDWLGLAGPSGPVYPGIVVT